MRRPVYKAVFSKSDIDRIKSLLEVCAGAGLSPPCLGVIEASHIDVSVNPRHNGRGMRPNE